VPKNKLNNRSGGLYPPRRESGSIGGFGGKIKEIEEKQERICLWNTWNDSIWIFSVFKVN